MNNIKLFLGTIKKCTEHRTIPHFTCEDLGGITLFGHIEEENEVYKENAVLVRTKNGYYIDVEGLSILDIAYLYIENKKGVYTGEPYMLSKTNGCYEGELFVDIDSIRPYTAKEEKKDGKSLIMLRKELRRR